MIQVSSYPLQCNYSHVSASKLSEDFANHRCTPCPFTSGRLMAKSTVFIANTREIRSLRHCPSILFFSSRIASSDRRAFATCPNASFDWRLRSPTSASIKDHRQCTFETCMRRLRSKAVYQNRKVCPTLLWNR